MTDVIITPLIDDSGVGTPQGRQPHFAYPFRIINRGGRVAAVTVSQDSSSEIAQCVFDILGTRLGARDDEPELGVVDPTFSMLDLDDIRSQVEQFEPRAVVLTDSQLNGLVQRVSVAVAVRQS